MFFFPDEFPQLSFFGRCFTVRLCSRGGPGGFNCRIHFRSTVGTITPTHNLNQHCAYEGLEGDPGGKKKNSSGKGYTTYNKQTLAYLYLIVHWPVLLLYNYTDILVHSKVYLIWLHILSHRLQFAVKKRIPYLPCHSCHRFVLFYW